MQLAMSRERQGLMAAIGVAGLLAIAAETGLSALGLVRYSAAWPMASVAPIWIVTLWMVFATCIPATDRMLGENALLKSFFLGAVIAPPTYWAGEGFGALRFAEPQWVALAAIGVVWAMAMPVMIRAYRHYAPRPTLQPAAS